MIEDMYKGLCAPALIFMVYVFIQIVLDFAMGNYNISLIKLIISIIIILFLNFLCAVGLYVFAWLFVFIPFVFLSLAVVMLLYSLRLKETSGKIESDDDEERPVPVVILPNRHIVQPMNNRCIIVTEVAPPKHGMRTKSNTKMYCM